MSEWWTYSPENFLMFSARTYYRLFERHNAALWPGHIVALLAGAAVFALLWRQPDQRTERIVGGVLASAATGAMIPAMVSRLHGSPLCGAVVGLVLGVFAQLGDLAESLIKRDCQVKDSGKALPGIGGVLDVLDSLLFTAPLFYGFLIYG